jgi:hypothetical protein
MKHLSSLLSLCFFLFLLSSCDKEKTNKDFTNDLTFGTSINYMDFSLNGEGTSFSSVPGNVAFRLESEEDFNSNPVKFVILKSGIAYSIEIFSNNPVPAGHIFMTTFNFSTAGQYSVTAYIVKEAGDKSVASATFQVN